VGKLDFVSGGEARELVLELEVIGRDEAESLVVLRDLCVQMLVQLLEDLREVRFRGRQHAGIVHHLHLVDVVDRPVDFELLLAFDVFLRLHLLRTDAVNLKRYKKVEFLHRNFKFYFKNSKFYKHFTFCSDEALSNLESASASGSARSKTLSAAC